MAGIGKRKYLCCKRRRNKRQKINEIDELENSMVLLFKTQKQSGEQSSNRVKFLTEERSASPFYKDDKNS